MMSLWRPGLSVVALLGLALAAAHGELRPEQFNPTRPLKVMAMGDSITDDCVTNGAWRLFLEPLLQAQGIPFTNTGRLQSSAQPGFAQRRHEGYCGAVIAPPGVFAVYNYSAVDNYLMKIVQDALAITNNRPDVMLILIGANDIGRGRNPWTVATNDLRILLNLINSRAPGTHVVLGKITTLQDASLGYGPFATNVPIYNAALQTLANQRRAAGQPVFVADMFSVVDYATMFLVDHLHPNPLGLAAIAKEWALRFETLLIRSNQFTRSFITAGANWRYSDAGSTPGLNWTAPDFDDGQWNSGPARLGYGDPATATPVSFGPVPTNKFITTYFRKTFVVPANAVVTNLQFRLAYADGAAVWLNGQELYRANLPAGPLGNVQTALSPVSPLAAHRFSVTNLSGANVRPGTNVVAVEVHLSSPTNSTLGFDLELIGSGGLLPLPSLVATREAGLVALSWPLTNGSGFALYSAINPGATQSWSRVLTSPWTNGDRIVVTQAISTGPTFYRLHGP
jgi:lysophospholipase L1-like esterase